MYWSHSCTHCPYTLQSERCSSGWRRGRYRSSSSSSYHLLLTAGEHPHPPPYTYLLHSHTTSGEREREKHSRKKERKKERKMTLHLNLPGSHHRSAEQQAQLREARRLLRDKIRNDWEYPPLPAWKSSGRHEAAKSAATEKLNVEDRIAGFRFHAPSTPDRANGVVGEALGLGFEPTEWREREDSDVSETESEVAAMTPAHTTSSSSKSKVETYKFDAPDSVGPQLHSRQQARKRKRWQAVHEEMEWNDGLAHWTRRRDVWCCARETRDVRLLEGSSGSGLADHPLPARGIVHIEVDSGSASGGSTPRTSTSSSVEAHVSSTPASTPSGSPDVTGAAAGSTAGTSLRSSPATIPLDVLVPIAPALLPKRKSSHPFH